jgi:hypothetical protein
MPENDDTQAGDPGVNETTEVAENVEVAFVTDTQRIGADGQPLEPPPGHGGRPQVGA